VAIGTYSDLATAVGNYLERGSTLNSAMPTFISVVEDECNRVLRTMDMEATEDIPKTGGIYPLPDDYLEFRQAIALVSPRRPLALVSPEFIEAQYPTREAGIPAYFSLIAGGIEVVPATDADVRLVYYARIPGLTQDSPTNWLLSRSPNVYLFGCLREAAIYIRDSEAITGFESRFQKALADLIADDKRRRYPRFGARLSMVTP